jgi:uncharacterized membrane protein YccC
MDATTGTAAADRMTFASLVATASSAVRSRRVAATDWRGDARRKRPSPLARNARLPGAARGNDRIPRLSGERWLPWIFAAKTTGAGLLALLIAFTFDLDQPKWALLTVFIVAQPQSGLVLAKSFYRIIGTVAGAAVALVLVALFAQERVLFLGTLALWLGVCTFASKNARNFAAYGFVLSGYTAAIVGITGALAPGNAFYVAVARVTEISIGLMTTAAISHLVLPASLANALRRAMAASRDELAGYTMTLLGGGDTAAQRTRLLGQVIAIESLRASAVFEDRDIRDRSDALRGVDMVMLGVIDVAHLLARSLDRLRRSGTVMGRGFDEGMAHAAAVIDLWRRGQLDATGLSRGFARASAELPITRHLASDASAADDEVIGRAAAIARLREFLAAFAAYARADEAASAPSVPPLTRGPRFSVSNDRADALWAGVRAALALLLVGTFWIEANWPSGPTATILAAVVTARLATMEHAVRGAWGGTLAATLASLPSFILVEVLLPQASGFPMFTLLVGPMLFCCALLMGREKTAGLGFVAALYFANCSAFQNRMAYDPVGFVNISIAVILALATAGVLFAIVAPDTAEAARRRFARAVRSAFEGIADRRRPIGLAAFEARLTEALDRFRRSLRRDRPADTAALEAGVALLGAGRELIRVRDGGRSTPGAIEVENAVLRFLGTGRKPPIEHIRRAARNAAATCLAELRDDRLDVADARAAAREMVAFAAIQDNLEGGSALLLEPRTERGQSHAA